MNNSSDDSFAAFVGIDWADAKHDICLLSADAKVPESLVIAHSAEAIEEWALSLQRRFNGQPIAVCLELNKGPLVSELCKYDFLALFPVNPQSLAHYRTVFSSSGAKDDPTDAQLQLDLLRNHRDRLKRLEPQSASIRSLQQLHRCWQDGTSYDESTHLKNLKKRGSPLLKHLSGDTTKQINLLDCLPQGVC
jgi:hypothetical protein